MSDRDPGAAGYRPTPLDTSGVTLSAELQELIERLAENAHDTWAASRLATGWRLGRRRSDRRRRHPWLVPYAQLSEEEKDIDRRVVEQTVSALLALGYEIRRPGP